MHNKYGNAYSEMGNIGNAISCMKQAHNIDPNNFQASYNLGNIFINMVN